jgi:hypothetical protein
MQRFARVSRRRREARPIGLRRSSTKLGVSRTLRTATSIPEGPMIHNLTIGHMDTTRIIGHVALTETRARASARSLPGSAPTTIRWSDLAGIGNLVANDDNVLSDWCPACCPWAGSCRLSPRRTHRPRVALREERKDTHFLGGAEVGECLVSRLTVFRLHRTALDHTRSTSSSIELLLPFTFFLLPLREL